MEAGVIGGRATLPFWLNIYAWSLLFHQETPSASSELEFSSMLSWIANGKHRIPFLSVRLYNIEPRIGKYLSYRAQRPVPNSSRDATQKRT